MLDPRISPFFTSLDKQATEAMSEEVARHTPISYWCTLFDDCVYSPKDFYEMVEQNLLRRQVPDLLRDYIYLHEGTLFSKRRLYYQMRRERIVAEICAAPFGSGFFISSRLFDRRRRAFFFDYVFSIVSLMAVSAPVLRWFDSMTTLVWLGIVFTTIWSLMRLATNVNFAWLEEKICQVPGFGPIYETWFHPNTYYRQDQHAMYREAVNRSVQEAVGALVSQKGLKPLTEAESKPVLPELR